MYPKSFLRELQHIECDLASGIKTLGQVEQMLSEEALPNPYYEMLYVICAFLRGAHRELLQCVQTCEQGAYPEP